MGLYISLTQPINGVLKLCRANFIFHLKTQGGSYFYNYVQLSFE